LFIIVYFFQFYWWDEEAKNPFLSLFVVYSVELVLFHPLKKKSNTRVDIHAFSGVLQRSWR